VQPLAVIFCWLLVTLKVGLALPDLLHWLLEEQLQALQTADQFPCQAVLALVEVVEA
jgi:hypothetical protein